MKREVMRAVILQMFINSSNMFIASVSFAQSYQAISKLMNACYVHVFRLKFERKTLIN